MRSEFKEKSLKSVKWVFLGSVLPKLASPISILLLTKYLIPEDFGKFSLAISIISFLNIIQDFGTNDYIIKEQKLSKIQIDNAFGINIILGFFLYFLLIIISLFFHKLFYFSEISKILPIIGLSVIFNSFGNVPRSLLTKDLLFKKLFLIQLFPIIINFLVIIPLAIANLGIWSLVTGFLFNQFLTNIYLISRSPLKPCFSFKLKYFFQIFKFSKYNVIEKLSEYFYTSLDLFILNIFISSYQLGIYAIVKSWLNIIFSLINGPIINISFPLLSKLNTSISVIKNIFLSILKRVLYLNFLLMILIINFSELFIRNFFNEKYWNIPTYISILVIGEGFSRSFSIQRDIFKILNKPHLFLYAILFNVLLISVLYPISLKYGIYYFLYIKVICDFIFTFFQIVLIKKYLDLKYLEIFKASSSVVFSALILNVLFYFLIPLYNQNIFEILFKFFLFIFFYLGLNLIFDFNFQKNLIRDILKSLNIKNI